MTKEEIVAQILASKSTTTIAQKLKEAVKNAAQHTNPA